MKNKFLLLTAVSILLFSCQKQNKKEIINKNIEPIPKSTFKTMENNLPYTSEEVKKYYTKDLDSVSYILNVKDTDLNNFTQTDITLPIKENDFEIKPNPQTRYFNVQSFNFQDGSFCKLIMYNTFGENDSKILNLQLNSYKKNKIVDKLLVDCRFTFEMAYYRTFIIKKNQTIEIVKYSFDTLEYNENGDITGENKNPEIKKTKVEYKINKDGKFIKI